MTKDKDKASDEDLVERVVAAERACREATASVRSYYKRSQQERAKREDAQREAEQELAAAKAALNERIESRAEAAADS